MQIDIGRIIGAFYTPFWAAYGQSECLMVSYEERLQMYDLEAIKRVNNKVVVLNKFVDVTKVLELQWDEYEFEY
jgi:hypothetical protein